MIESIAKMVASDSQPLGNTQAAHDIRPVSASDVELADAQRVLLRSAFLQQREETGQSPAVVHVVNV